jgi:diacylglycerol kinase family enzyme
MPGGHHVDMAEVASLTTHGGLLECSPPQLVNVDGEIVMKTPVSFGIAAKALRVRVPETFGA